MYELDPFRPRHGAFIEAVEELIIFGPLPDLCNSCSRICSCEVPPRSTSLHRLQQLADKSLISKLLKCSLIAGASDGAGKQIQGRTPNFKQG